MYSLKEKQSIESIRSMSQMLDSPDSSYVEGLVTTSLDDIEQDFLKSNEQINIFNLIWKLVGNTDSLFTNNQLWSIAKQVDFKRLVGDSSIAPKLGTIDLNENVHIMNKTDKKNQKLEKRNFRTEKYNVKQIYWSSLIAG